MFATVLGIVPGVCHQNQNHTTHQAHGLPTLLTVLSSVLPCEVQGIFKHPLRGIETDTVLAPITGVLDFVP